MGVCIETRSLTHTPSVTTVTPYMGVCIETFLVFFLNHHRIVTPYMGVCIETFARCLVLPRRQSHPIYVSSI